MEVNNSIDLENVLSKVKDEFNRCIQCGKCVGICPAAEISSFNSRKIIHMVKTGDINELLSNDYIWSCVLCASCYAVCPNGINFPAALMLLRVVAFYYGNGWELERLSIPFVENYLNTGITVSEADAPAIAEILKNNTGTDGTVRAIRESMELEPKRKISEQAMCEITILANNSGLLEKLNLLKNNEQSKNLIDELYKSKMCAGVFKMIEKLPGGKHND